ncbi:centrosomal protein of 19 kDa [Clonorchis sinensis]|uniref:Centrosomal protein of 19 kDa n=1 Tax=Clonorchis sinensis TaxID=79923 RepID=G7Y5S6_CLOSI|nr:centrosomal protein of 19 kDa [Clonorchis sinensis]
MDMQVAEVRRCGIRRDPPALVVVYHLGLKTRKRTIKLADVRDKSVVDLFSELMKDSSTKNLLQNVPKSQLMRLLTILRDLIHNVPLHESIKRCDEEDVISSGEDLNTVHPDLLERKKAIMDELFEQNRIDPTHPEFEYDKEVDFPQDKVETCLWDSDECEL